jgi:U4/U6 small nuclear ribonucleoprotein PRP3
VTEHLERNERNKLSSD